MPKAIRVLIDAHMVGEREAGNETYIINLIRGLQQLPGPDTYLLATAHLEEMSRIIPAHERFRPVAVSASPIKRLLLDLPRIARRENADLLHVTYMGPPWPGVPYVATIHDVINFSHPEWFSPRDRAILWAGITRSAQRAAAILTLSEHSKRDIHEKIGAPLSRIHAIHLAADDSFVQAPTTGNSEALLSRLAIPGPYVLAVGSLQPRKNLSRLIEAFAFVKRALNIPHRLLLVGKAAWNNSVLHQAIRRYQIESDVIFTGYVPDAELVQLYQGADLFVYPSLYEGFGLPVIEAMACGAPVITSNITSMPEIAGDAALLVDPYSTEEIAGAMKRVLQDEGLRTNLRTRGPQHARQFSWRKMAEATQAVYRAVVRGDERGAT